MSLFTKSKCVRVIDHLRKTYGGTWRYDRSEFPPYRGDSFNVYAESHTIWCHCECGNCFSTHYRRDDTREEVNIPGRTGRTYST